jgi:CHAP domain
VKLLADIAAKYLGTAEIPKGSNCGPVVNEFKAATTLDPKGNWPWCAAFVSYCVQKLIPATDGESIDKPPLLAAAYSFESWGKKNNALVFKPSQIPPYKIEPGDIAIYNFSHVGIVSKGGTKTFEAIEGNTDSAGGREGYEVARKTRSTSLVKCFVRIARKAKAV